jgi:hypothetical protein
MASKLITGLVLLLFALGIFFTWGTSVNGWRWDIDLNSGKLRASRLILWISVKEQFEESPLFSIIQIKKPADEKPIWRTMNFSSPGFIPSQENCMNGFLDQIRDLTIVWEQTEFSPVAKRLVALHLMDAWKRGEKLGMTGRYVSAIKAWVKTFPNEKKVEEIDIQEFNRSISK